MTQLRMDADGPVVHRHLGQVPYARAWDLQRELVAQRQADEVPDQLLTLEPSV